MAANGIGSRSDAVLETVSHSAYTGAMAITDPQAKPSRRKGESKEGAFPKRPRVATEHIVPEVVQSPAHVLEGSDVGEAVEMRSALGNSGPGPTFGPPTGTVGRTPRRVASKLAVVGAAAHDAADDDKAPEMAEAAFILQRINGDLTVEEALVAQLMKRHGL